MPDTSASSRPLVLFAGLMGGLMNVKYAFLHAATHDCGFDAHLLSTLPQDVKIVRSHGLAASLAPGASAGLAARASLIVLDNFAHIGGVRQEDLAGKPVLQLWHGVPLKKIGFPEIASPVNMTPEKARYLEVNYSGYAGVISSTPWATDLFRQAFRAETFPETGYPRNDILTRPPNKWDLINTDSNLYGLLRRHKAAGGKVAVYMPTFRDTGSTFLGDQVLDLRLINAFCKRRNIFFLAKFHPALGVSVDGSMDALAVYDSRLDIYPLLPLADVLVTDYSSVYFDFMYTDKPLIFFPYDKDRYLSRDRELFFDYEAMTPGDHVTTQEDLLGALHRTVIEGRDDHAAARRDLRDRVFGRIDAGASERVCGWIRERVNRVTETDHTSVFLQERAAEKTIRNRQTSSNNRTYKVTAIVSVYKAGKFIRGCLEDLTGQTIFDQVEVIVIDACSPDDEGTVVREFQARYPNIVYFRTQERETLYASWNRAARMARGTYLTNANADDRHHPDCFRRLAEALDAHPEVALVYADQRITSEPNSVFETAPICGRYAWRDYDHLNLLRRCEIGPQPMWRASLHKEIGYFDDTLRIVGDLEFWLRISEKYPLLHIQEDLGLYLRTGENLELRDRQKSYEEERTVKEEALRRFLHPSFTWRSPLEPLLRIHTLLLSESLQKLSQGLPCDPEECERHFYACALLKAKLGDIAAAKTMLREFFDLFGESKNACHLYRLLFLTSPSLPPGVMHTECAVSEPALVGVVIPLYNQGRYLEEAVRSVLAQTEPRWEMIIVNDGSTDDSLKLAKAILRDVDDPRIRLVSQANSGKGKTRNRGVTATSAPFVCILDADDMVCPDYFATAVALLENNPDVGWICPQTLVFGGSNHVTWTWEYDFFASLLKCPGPVTSIYRRSLYDEVQGYDESMIDAEDYEFWIKAGEQGWIGKTTSEILFIYRHAFQRYGCQPKINLKRKQQYVERHPWWYRQLPKQTMNDVFRASPVVEFPKSFLNMDAVQQARQYYGDKEKFRACVDRLKLGSKSCRAQHESCRD